MTSERLLRLKRLTDKHEGRSDFSFTAETKLFIYLLQNEREKAREYVTSNAWKWKGEAVIWKKYKQGKNIPNDSEWLKVFSQNDIVSNVRALLSLIFKFSEAEFQ